ncbi:hypothetical protein CDAR_245971 [Caerostris darwini]|uniref:Uncharacterized protein n=1 Tax=Caerostris darwini TaxID=1538125 RepID=A0AAV4TFK9_9ARAC|nr:hypothetical protein CDAR_245971 [Caerostris darwini]
MIIDLTTPKASALSNHRRMQTSPLAFIDQSPRRTRNSLFSAATLLIKPKNSPPKRAPILKRELIKSDHVFPDPWVSDSIIRISYLSLWKDAFFLPSFLLFIQTAHQRLE